MMIMLVRGRTKITMLRQMNSRMNIDSGKTNRDDAREISRRRQGPQQGKCHLRNAVSGVGGVDRDVCTGKMKSTIMMVMLLQQQCGWRAMILSNMTAIRTYHLLMMKKKMILQTKKRQMTKVMITRR